MTNLRDESDFAQSHWHWDFLNECFAPTKIKVTDIDGFVERNGRFLVIETKKPCVDIPQGQDIMFKSMIETGLFSVIIIWGHRDTPQEVEVRTPKRVYAYDEASAELVQNLVRQWFAYANRTKKVEAP